MSLIHITTKRLIEMLTDLALTTNDTGMPGTGVLLHSARGYVTADEPGKTDLLVGTSSTGRHIGHAWEAADGYLPPTLLRLDDVQTVIATCTKKSKGRKGHTVDLTVQDGHLVVAETPELFGETSLASQAQPLDDFPRGLWNVLAGDLSYVTTATEPAPRTDISAEALTALGKIGARRGYTPELYRHHQDQFVLVRIGDRYRGAVRPLRWDSEGPRAGEAPDGDLYPPTLPAPDEA